MNKTKIEWCDYTWNPISGCSKISEGCRHCYAERMAKRLRGRYGYPQIDPFMVTYHCDKLDEPTKLKKPKTIFTVSMGDMFHQDVPNWWRNDIFRVIQRCPNHTFMILTKRPLNMRDYMLEVARVRSWPEDEPVFENVVLGVSVEDQYSAETRIPILCDIPAAMRFISYEPMLEEIDLEAITMAWCKSCRRVSIDNLLIESARCEKCGSRDIVRQFNPYYFVSQIVCGMETGPSRRPMKPEWASKIKAKCQEFGINFLFKQAGRYPID